MKFKDLEKKLENIEVPEIEIQSHQQRLKLALLSSGYFKEKPIMFWTKRLVPAGVALALILVVGFSVINPKLQIARAMEIAKNDPQIKELMEEYGVEIKQVKLQDGKAYVLLALPEEKLPPLPGLEKRALSLEEETGMPGMRGPGQFYIVYHDPETGEIIESSGSVVEIDLKAKKVEKIELIEKMQINITPLTEEEKARAIEIAKTERKIQEMIPDLEKREIIVKPLPPIKLKLQLEEDFDGGMEITSADIKEDKRANVIFKSDEYQDMITVDLTTGKVEGAVSFSTGRIEEKEKELREEYPYPIKPKFYLEDEGIILEPLPDEGVIISEGQLSGPGSAAEKEMFAAMLKEIGEKDDRIKDLLKDNDYEILEIIRSKPIVEKTETSDKIRVETTTVVLEKESTGEDYWITIDMGSMTVESIKSE